MCARDCCNSPTVAQNAPAPSNGCEAQLACGQRPARVVSLPRPQPRPGPGNSSPAWAWSKPECLGPSIFIRRSSVLIGWTKPWWPAASLNPKPFFVSPFYLFHDRAAAGVATITISASEEKGATREDLAPLPLSFSSPFPLFQWHTQKEQLRRRQPVVNTMEE
jgi:hypothetical protein